MRKFTKNVLRTGLQQLRALRGKAHKELQRRLGDLQKSLEELQKALEQQPEAGKSAQFDDAEVRETAKAYLELLKTVADQQREAAPSLKLVMHGRRGAPGAWATSDRGSCLRSRYGMGSAQGHGYGGPGYSCKGFSFGRGAGSGNGGTPIAVGVPEAWATGESGWGCHGYGYGYVHGYGCGLGVRGGYGYGFGEGYGYIEEQGAGVVAVGAPEAWAIREWGLGGVSTLGCGSSGGEGSGVHALGYAFVDGGGEEGLDAEGVAVGAPEAWATGESNRGLIYHGFGYGDGDCFGSGYGNGDGLYSFYNGDGEGDDDSGNDSLMEKTIVAVGVPGAWAIREWGYGCVGHGYGYGDGGGNGDRSLGYGFTDGSGEGDGCIEEQGAGVVVVGTPEAWAIREWGEAHYYEGYGSHFSNGSGVSLGETEGLGEKAIVVVGTPEAWAIREWGGKIGSPEAWPNEDRSSYGDGDCFGFGYGSGSGVNSIGQRYWYPDEGANYGEVAVGTPGFWATRDRGSCLRSRYGTCSVDGDGCGNEWSQPMTQVEVCRDIS